MGELEPEIHQRAVPREVLAQRERFAEILPGLEAILQPRLEGHLLVLQQTIDRLRELHGEIVDQSDLDLDAATRWVALWELSGRCLAVANLFLAELRLGYTAETAGTIRVIDEGVNLLHALAGDEDGNLVRRWLDGETVMPRDVRSIMRQVQNHAGVALAAQGVELDGDVVELGREVYGHLSQAAHNARPGFVESVSRPLRLFNTGPHPDPRQRAVYADYASELIEAVVIGVGSALARFLGGEWYRDTIRPLQAELEAVRQALPVDEAARAALGF